MSVVSFSVEKDLFSFMYMFVCFFQIFLTEIIHFILLIHIPVPQWDRMSVYWMLSKLVWNNFFKMDNLLASPPYTKIWMLTKWGYNIILSAVRLVFTLGGKRVFLWCWIVWQLWCRLLKTHLRGEGLLSLFSWHDYWDLWCSSISYHLPHVNGPFPHSSWLVVYLLWSASLFWMTLSHLHAALVSKTSWYVLLLLLEVSKINVSY